MATIDRRTGGLDIDLLTTDRVAFARIAGELDASTAPTLIRTVERLIEAGSRDVVLDCAELAFCDSIGLSTFVDAHRRCAAPGGYLALAAPSPFMHKLLGVVGLTRQVPAYATVASACAAMRAAARIDSSLNGLRT